ncbi:protein peste isoform X2 [Aethina tumida]|uniref:protein peste isoform X2 n=1 Tax=Aethina tumida TaxID=116153 RepID=UPI00096B5908|nr:protein peste isoform X2 [Aethina tumida]
MGRLHINHIQHPERKSNMRKRRRLWLTIIQLIVGIKFIGAGTLLYFKFEDVYEMMLRKGLEINPTSKAFNVWKKNDPPLIMNVYLFNWTNPEDLRVPGTKPILQEIGPYRFKEVKEKTNISFDDVSHTVSYRHRKSYYFDAENSDRNLSDVITTLNPVPLTAAFKSRNAGYFRKLGLSALLSQTHPEGVHITKTAGEILFDGYEDSLLSAISYMPFMETAPERFGLFYGKNGTIGSDGSFVMSTANDETFGRLLSWNNGTSSNFYEGECNSVKGSAGEFYPLNRKRDSIQFYSSELCKFATLEYEHDVDIKGVHGYKYTAKHIFDNGTTREDNSCFCIGECIPSGVLNVSSCRGNSPSFLSFPHFYGADRYYTDAVEGLDPDNPKHEFYITMEPKSGIIMDLSAKMQLNFLLQPDDVISLYKNVPKIFMPFFYFDQDVRLKDELAENLRLIQNLPDYSLYLSFILISLGILMVIWAICSMFYCRHTKLQSNTQCHAGEEVPLQNRIKQIS